MSFTEAVSVCLSKYVTFSGRARRSEYWWFVLLGGGVNVFAAIVDNVAGTSIFAIVAGLGLFLPGLAVAIRRLHDTNRSGWWYLLVFVPFGAVAPVARRCRIGKVKPAVLPVPVWAPASRSPPASTAGIAWA